VNDTITVFNLLRLSFIWDAYWFISGARKVINSELWHACAGPLVSLPQVGSLVYYFPQGHSEQVCIYFPYFWILTFEELPALFFILLFFSFLNLPFWHLHNLLYDALVWLFSQYRMVNDIQKRKSQYIKWNGKGGRIFLYFCRINFYVLLDLCTFSFLFFFSFGFLGSRRVPTA
jgi:hypothetical protein